MIFLTRLVLNPRSRRAQSEVRNPYEMHRTLSRAFGEDKENWQKARCLFRLELQQRTSEPNGIVVLVQSTIAPSWDYLETTHYLLASPCMKSVSLKLPPGIRLAFRLRANPTVCRDGKRTPLRTEQDRIAWMERKGETHGFHVISSRMSLPEIVQCRTAEGQPVTLQAITYDGVLQVVSEDSLLTAVEQGIGPAKGLGFGLLSVARAPA